MESLQSCKRHKISHRSPHHEEGNRLYKRAFTPGNSPRIQRVLLDKAIKEYEKALAFAGQASDEVASMEKNLGVAHFKVCDLCLTELDVPATVASRMHAVSRDYRSKALRHLMSAFSSGRTGGKDADWMKGIEGLIEEVLQKGIQQLEDLVGQNGEAKHWIRHYFTMIQHVDIKSHLVKPHLKLAEALFRTAIRAREKQDFKEALYCLKEMVFPLEEAAQHTLDEFVLTEVRIHREEMQTETYIAEAMQAIEFGGKLISQAVFGGESLNMTLVFEAMDWFKKAALQARGYDLEQEARACHHLGHIYETILKLKGRAKDYYMQVMSLTEAAKPRTFHSQIWYRDTTNSLKNFQFEAAQRDDEEKQKRRQVYMDQLKEELKEISNANTDVYELVNFLLEKYPPKQEVSKRKFKEADRNEMKVCEESPFETCEHGYDKTSETQLYHECAKNKKTPNNDQKDDLKSEQKDEGKNGQDEPDERKNGSNDKQKDEKRSEQEDKPKNEQNEAKNGQKDEQKNGKKDEQKNGEPKDSEELKKKKKKLLLKLIGDYHPDKNAAEKHGMKWQVLSEEITKKITCYYECMK